MKLPKQLTFWYEILSLFPDDIAGLIHDVAKKLTPLIHSIKQVEIHGEIEPDGFNGLTKLANYDRLLLTEWALLDQYPDEFIRRAVSGEHLFLDVQRVESSHEKQCIALFDCGPEQLGRPRLVQLATLILLARRAEKENMSFTWGILQDNDCTLYNSVSKNFIKAWLNQRSIIIAQQSHLDNWLSSLSENSEQLHEAEIKCSTEQTNEFWLITKNTLVSDNLRTQSIHISEPLLKPDYIDVSVIANTTKQSLSLKLGEEALNVRVIRDPFNEAQNTQYLMTENHMGMWKLAINGLRIACFNSIGKLAIYSINKFKFKKHQLQQYINFNENEVCIGIHLTKKLCVLVTVDESYINIYEYPNTIKIKRIYRNKSIQFPDKGKLLDIVIARDKQVFMLFMLDTAKQLHCLDLLDVNSGFNQTESCVISLGQNINCIYSISLKEKEMKMEVQWYLGHNPNKITLDIVSSKQSAKVFVHGSGIWYKSNFGALAYENDNDIWTVFSGNNNYQNKYDISVKPDEQVLGVINIDKGMFANIPISDYKNKIALVTLKPDAKSIHAVWDAGDQLITTLEHKFVSGELNTQHLLVHYKNLDNDMLVVNLQTGNIIFQLDQGTAT